MQIFLIDGETETMEVYVHKTFSNGFYQRLSKEAIEECKKYEKTSYKEELPQLKKLGFQVKEKLWGQIDDKHYVINLKTQEVFFAFQKTKKFSGF